MILLEAFWKYLNLTAPYLLMGMLLSGVFHLFVKQEWLEKSLGKRGFWPLFLATMIGAPLPLCSCSVIPAAVSLKKKGATNGTTSAFLISTPETGIDSILLTYSLMDFPMTIIRPLVTIVTALCAGVFQDLFNRDERKMIALKNEDCCHHCHDHDHSKAVHSVSNVMKKWREFYHFVMVDLVDDMGKWLFVGIIGGALIDLYLPLELIHHFNGLAGRLVVLALGIPLYICASTSTPIAASLVMKGMSPGTALIFLLSGPATNFSSLVLMQKYIGKKGVFINVAVIAVVSLIFSYLVDGLYSSQNWPILFKVTSHEEHTNYWVTQMSSVALLLLMIKGTWSDLLKHKEGAH